MVPELHFLPLVNGKLRGAKRHNSSSQAEHRHGSASHELLLPPQPEKHSRTLSVGHHSHGDKPSGSPCLLSRALRSARIGQCWGSGDIQDASCYMHGG